MFPIAILGSTLPTTGMYQYTSRLLSPKTGVFWLMLFMFLQITYPYMRYHLRNI